MWYNTIRYRKRDTVMLILDDGINTVYCDKSQQFFECLSVAIANSVETAKIAKSLGRERDREFSGAKGLTLPRLRKIRHSRRGVKVTCLLSHLERQEEGIEHLLGASRRVASLITRGCQRVYDSRERVITLIGRAPN